MSYYFTVSNFSLKGNFDPELFECAQIRLKKSGEEVFWSTRRPISITATTAVSSPAAASSPTASSPTAAASPTKQNASSAVVSCEIGPLVGSIASQDADQKLAVSLFLRRSAKNPTSTGLALNPYAWVHDKQIERVVPSGKSDSITIPGSKKKAPDPADGTWSTQTFTFEIGPEFGLKPAVTATLTANVVLLEKLRPQIVDKSILCKISVLPTDPTPPEKKISGTLSVGSTSTATSKASSSDWPSKPLVCFAQFLMKYTTGAENPRAVGSATVFGLRSELKSAAGSDSFGLDLKPLIERFGFEFDPYIIAPNNNSNSDNKMITRQEIPWKKGGKIAFASPPICEILMTLEDKDSTAANAQATAEASFSPSPSRNNDATNRAASPPPPPPPASTTTATAVNNTNTNASSDNKNTGNTNNNNNTAAAASPSASPTGRTTSVTFADANNTTTNTSGSSPNKATTSNQASPPPPPPPQSSSPGFVDTASKKTNTTTTTASAAPATNTNSTSSGTDKSVIIVTGRSSNNSSSLSGASPPPPSVLNERYQKEMLLQQQRNKEIKRIKLEAVKAKLMDDELKSILQNFQTFDRDKNGVLDYDEVTAAIKEALKGNMGSEENLKRIVSDFIAACDDDSDGRVSYNELKSTFFGVEQGSGTQQQQQQVSVDKMIRLQKIKSKLMDDEIKKILLNFVIFDKNGDGNLDKQELFAAVKSVLNGNVSGDDAVYKLVDEIIAVCDDNKDGSVSIQEIRQNFALPDPSSILYITTNINNNAAQDELSVTRSSIVRSRFAPPMSPPLSPTSLNDNNNIKMVPAAALDAALLRAEDAEERCRLLEQRLQEWERIHQTKSRRDNDAVTQIYHAAQHLAYVCEASASSAIPASTSSSALTPLSPYASASSRGFNNNNNSVDAFTSLRTSMEDAQFELSRLLRSPAVPGVVQKHLSSIQGKVLKALEDISRLKQHATTTSTNAAAGDVNGGGGAGPILFVNKSQVEEAVHQLRKAMIAGGMD